MVSKEIFSYETPVNKEAMDIGPFADAVLPKLFSSCEGIFKESLYARIAVELESTKAARAKAKAIFPARLCHHGNRNGIMIIRARTCPHSVTATEILQRRLVGACTITRSASKNVVTAKINLMISIIGISIIN